MNTISEICQKRVEQHITEGITGSFAYQDNVIIVGCTLEKHDSTLEKVLDKIAAFRSYVKLFEM